MKLCIFYNHQQNSYFVSKVIYLLVISLITVFCDHHNHLPSNESGNIDFVTSQNPLHSQWEKITANDALNYFTSYEICLWYRREIECKDHFSHIEGAGDLGVCNTPSYCRVNSLLMKHKSTQPWPDGKTILDIILLMKKHGGNTLFLIGDSVSSQMQDDAECNLRRYNLMVNRHIVSFDNFPSKSFVAIDLIDSNSNSTLISDIPYFRIIVISDSYKYSSNSFEEINIGSYDIIQYYLTHGPVTNSKQLFIFNTGLHFTISDNSNPEVLDAHNLKYKTLIRHLIYNVSQDLIKNDHIVMYRETSAQHFKTKNGIFSGDKNIKDIERSFFSAKQNRMSLIQLLGYRSGMIRSDDFELDNANLESKLLKIKNLPKSKHFIDNFLIQYLDSSRPLNDLLEENNIKVVINDKEFYLYHPQNYPETDFYGCKPIDNLEALYEQDILNRIAVKEIEDSKLKIGIIYFHNITAGRWDLHQSSYGVYGDCTHFCNTPLLWQPVWNQIYRLYNE